MDIDFRWGGDLSIILAVEGHVASLLIQVYDEDKLQQDKKMCIAKLGLQELEHDVTKGIELNLLASLDTLKVKDKDRGSLTIKTHSASNTVCRLPSHDVVHHSEFKGSKMEFLKVNEG